MRRLLCVLFAVWFLVLPFSMRAAGPPVVPGASGFGMETRAAYACGTNPTVWRVTNLNDSGSGSLRAALEAAGPRVVIFETSGYINMASDLWITNPCLTVAGQTAPSPGITVRMVAGATEAMFLLNTHDVLLQHLRIRPGNATCSSGMQVYGGQQYNIVLDHMSFSWGQDENVFYTGGNSGNDNSTIWRSIMAEGLFNAPATTGCTGGGSSNGHGLGVAHATNLAVLQNLFAHNLERNPQVGSGSRLYVANNVNYHTHEGHFFANVNQNSDPTQETYRGNYYKRGSGGDQDYVLLLRYWQSGQAQLYVDDNAIDNGGLSPGLAAFTIIDGADPRVGSPPVSISGYTVLSSSVAYTTVLANAGARPLDRDAVDTRIVNDVVNRTGNYISQPSDVGGYPTLAVNTRALTIPSNPHIVQSSGYTALEEWLHGFAAAVESGAAPPLPPTNVRITALAANAETDALCALLNNGFLDLYDGTQPATADTAITSQIRLASLGFSATACAAAINGVAAANAITGTLAADASGTATWFRAWKSDHTTIVFDGSIGTTDADLVLTTTGVLIGKPVRVTAFTITSRML